MAALAYGYVILCFIATTMLYSSEGGLLGAYSEWKPGDEDVQEIATKVRQQAESTCQCGTFSSFEVLRYKSQVVAGMNYIMEVDVGDGRKIEIEVYKPPYNSPELVELDLIE